MTSSSALATLIRESRIAHGWDQAELTRRLGGVSQQTVSRWENGAAIPRATKLARLAAVLEADEASLIAASRVPLGLAPAPEAVARYVPSLQTTLPFELLSEVQFEEFTVAFMQAKYPQATVYRNGTRGHKQDGIDVFIDHADGQPRGGVQCKQVQKFGRENVRKAVADFDPATGVTEPTIFLSRAVSPGARATVNENPPWKIMGGDEIALAITQLDIDAQLRLIKRFFPALRPTFLGVPNPSPWLSVEEYRQPLGSRDGLFSQDWDLVGRDDELAKLRLFALESGTGVLAIEGPSGSGKTRVLLGLADSLEEDPTIVIRFLDSGTELTSPDYESLPSTPRLLLVVEDAHKRTDIAALVRGVLGQQPDARFLFATRNQNRREVEDQLRSVGRELRTGENLLQLPSLTFLKARELAKQVLRPEITSSNVTDALAALGTDSPFLAVVGGQLLKQGRINTPTFDSSPELRNQILEAFRGAMVGGGPAVDVELRIEVLNAVAAMQPFRSYQEAFRDAIQKLTGKKYRHVAAVLSQLLDAGLLIRKSASYRVAPDLLGDIVLSRALVYEDSGQVSSYPAELLAALPDDAFEHALVNVSRVDSQLQRGGQATDTVVEALWSPFRREIEIADVPRRIQLAELLEKVAYYQPERALEATRWLVEHPIIGPELESKEIGGWALPVGRNSDVRRALASVAERICYSPAFLPGAMNLLKDLAALDPRRPKHSADGDPASILRKVFDFSRPLDYLAVALDTAMGWLEGDDVSDVDRALVAEIVAPLLATEGSEDRADGVTLHFFPYSVNLAAVETLRRRVIAWALEELRSSEPARVARSVDMLEDALRYPSGMFGRSVSQQELDGWIPDFLLTLEAIERLVIAQPNKTTILAVRDILHWHAKYRDNEVSVEARRILNNLPEDLESDVALALRGSSALFAHSDYYEDSRKKQEWQQAVAARFLEAKSDVEILEIVSREIAANEVASKPGEPGMFFQMLILNRHGVASLLLDRVLAEPTSPLTRLASLAVQRISFEPAHFEETMTRLTTSPAVALRRAAAHAIAWGKRGEFASVPSGMQYLRTFLADEDGVVQSYALTCLQDLSLSDPAAAGDLLELVDFSKSKDLAGDVAALFGKYGGLKWSGLPAARQRAILDQLAELADIEDYQVEEFLDQIAESDSDAILSLLMQRVERAEAKEVSRDYQALPFHWHGNLRLTDSPHKEPMLHRIWKWMGEEPRSWKRQHYGAQIWWLVAGEADQKALAFLEGRLQGAGGDFQVMGNIFKELPREFVRDNVEFVAKALTVAQSNSEESLRRIGAGLSASVTSGVRSRAIGVPDPEDIKERDLFAEIAARYPTASPVRRFYESMSDHAEREIKWHAEDDAAMLDNKTW